jgi:hypothetical protein
MKRFSWAALLLLLAGCSSMIVPGAQTDEAQYTKIYPYYAEFCALSSLGKYDGFGVELTSGPGGHAVLYLNDVCRAGIGSSQLALCPPETPADQRGVGLSVNAHYKNAEWVAVPGRDFFFHGTLTAGEGVTRDGYAETKLAAEDLGIYQNIIFNEEYFDDLPPATSRQEWQYEISIATDYATDLGRARVCARAPLDKAQMVEIVNYLNRLNDPFRTGVKEFHWDLFEDNCAHMAHNALSAAGIWPQWETNRTLLTSIFDFPVPKNEVVNLMRRGNDLDLANLEAIYRDDGLREDLLHHDYLPVEPGVLAEAAPIASPNEVYDTRARLIFYDDPFFGTYQTDFDRFYAEPRYTDLAANLAYFAELYAHIAAKRRPVETYAADFQPDDFKNFSAFYRHYYAYIDRQAAKVATARSLLAAGTHL